MSEPASGDGASIGGLDEHRATVRAPEDPRAGGRLPDTPVERPARVEAGERSSSTSDRELDAPAVDATDRERCRRRCEGVDRVFRTRGDDVDAARRTAARVFQLNDQGAPESCSGSDASPREVRASRPATSSVGRCRAGEAARHGGRGSTFTIGHLGIAYADSKHEAEVEALRLAADGLPVVIVNPSFVLGPDDPKGTSMQLVRRFLLGRIPAYVDGGLNIVDVRGIAQGQLLADKKGQAGERYILGGRNFTLQRLFADLSRISGAAPPAMRLPAPLAIGGVEVIRRLGIPLPVSREEVRSGTLWWTYRSTKAKKELGFEARPHEETLEDAVRWQLSVLDEKAVIGSAPMDMPLKIRRAGPQVGERLVGR